jgi:hypothetical protein
MFSNQPFPQQFPPTSNPFVQQSFGASKINYQIMKKTNKEFIL